MDNFHCGVICREYNYSMRKFIQGFVWVILIVMCVDVLGFVAWSMSGQRPADDFYAGIISKNIINNLIK